MLTYILVLILIGILFGENAVLGFLIGSLLF